MIEQTPAQAPAENSPLSIGDVAKGFLADLDANEDPNQMEPHDHSDPAEAPEGEPDQETQPEAAEEAKPNEPETPMVEVELEDGVKVQIPENIKPHLMRDKDYRQKTMQLAEQRKHFEYLTASAQQLAQQAQQMAPYHAQLHAMESRANQLSQALQSRELMDDPIEFNRTQGELAILLRNRDQFAGSLAQMQSAFNEQQTRLRMERLNAEAPRLFEEIPDFQKPETRESLGKYVREQGINEEEFYYMNFSVPASKLAWKAMQYDRMVKDQAKVKAELSKKAQSSPTATTNQRAAPQAAQDKKLRDEWRKGGGKLHDANFSALLRQKLR